MKKWMLAGFGLMLTVLVLPACGQGSTKTPEKMNDASSTWVAREQAFLKKSNVAPDQTVVYKVLATKNEFEALRTAKPSMLISDKIIGDVRVVTERSEAEMAYFASSGMDVKALKASDMPSMEKTKISDVEVKQTVYRRVASYQEYQEMLDRSQKLTTVKMMMDSLTWFMEKSEVEIAAERAMESPHKVLKGLPFPSFQLTTADGRTLDETVFKSKLTVVNFFFDKCAPCIEETPALNQFAKDHPEIQVLSMTFDKLKQAQKYVEEHHFTWPIVVSASKVISEELEIRSFPSFVLVDENGVMLGERTGGDSSGNVSKKLHDWILNLRPQPAK